MEYLPHKSKQPFYDVFQREDGEHVVVLQGLHVEDVYEPPAMQTFIHQYYDMFIYGYWILFILTFAYLISVFIASPLIRRLFH